MASLLLLSAALICTATPAVLARSLVFRHEGTGLWFRLPAGWQKATDVRLRNASAPGATYSDATGSARLAISIEKSPIRDLSLVPRAIEQAAAHGALPLFAKPAITRFNDYPCVVVEPTQRNSTRGTIGSLFVHFIIEDLEIAFKLVGAGSQYDQARSQFLAALSQIRIERLPRGAPAGPVVYCNEYDATIVGPAGFLLEQQNAGSLLARFTDSTSEAVFDVTRHRVPLVPLERLAEEFSSNLKNNGFTILSLNTGKQGIWPHISLQTKASMDGIEVAISFNLVVVLGNAFQVASTCLASHAKEFQARFAVAARALRVGPESFEFDQYRNASFLEHLGERSESFTVEQLTSISRLDRSEPTATLLLPLLRSYEPYQSLELEGWSAPPSTVIFDQWGNADGVFFLTGLGTRSTHRMVVRSNVQLRSAQMTLPTTLTACNLPPLMQARLTSPSPGCPVGHPRLDGLAASFIGTTSDRVSRIRALFDGVVRHTTRTAPPEQSISTWGKGALFALTHPGECGPLERCDLLIALMRRQAIASRHVYGYLVAEDGLSKAPRPHAWCELYLPPAGWVPADPTPLTTTDQPVLGRWSARYIVQAVESEGAHGSGPDRAFLGHGHERTPSSALPCSLEVQLVVQ